MKPTRITFNTPGSHRVLARCRSLVTGMWSINASLGSKRKSCQGYVLDTQAEETVKKLKLLGCTKIKTENGK